MTIEIREISNPDEGMLTQIGRLRVEAWSAEIPAAREMRVWIDDWDRDALHWIALDRERIVASARLTVHGSIHDVPHQRDFVNDDLRELPTPIGSINRLVVHPDYRGRGLATRCDNLRIERARKLGCRTVLGTPIGDHRIRSLEKLGFARVAISHGPISHGPISHGPISHGPISHTYVPVLALRLPSPQATCANQFQPPRGRTAGSLTEMSRVGILDHSERNSNVQGVPR